MLGCGFRQAGLSLAASTRENDMVRKTVAALALPVGVLTFPIAPVVAQDIVPIISPGLAAEGIFQRSRSDAEARRQRDKDDASSQAPAQPQARPSPGPAEYQKACDNRPLYRKQYGDDDPRIQKLEDLCKEAGY
jgi:hypothetical protein